MFAICLADRYFSLRFSIHVHHGFRIRSESELQLFQFLRSESDRESEMPKKNWNCHSDSWPIPVWFWCSSSRASNQTYFQFWNHHDWPIWDDYIYYQCVQLQLTMCTLWSIITFLLFLKFKVTVSNALSNGLLHVLFWYFTTLFDTDY